MLPLLLAIAAALTLTVQTCLMGIPYGLLYGLPIRYHTLYHCYYLLCFVVIYGDEIKSNKRNKNHISHISVVYRITNVQLVL